MPLVNHQTDEGVVVPGLYARLCRPFRQAQGSSVLALDDDALTVQPYPGDVTSITGTGLDPAVDAVVVERGG